MTGAQASCLPSARREARADTRCTFYELSRRRTLSPFTRFARTAASRMLALPSCVTSVNKIEYAHRFAKAIAFGSSQEITQAEKEDQDISAECRRLIENSVICWNYLYLTHKLTKANQDDEEELLRAIKEESIITWRYINFYGEYDFSEEKLKDSVGFDLPEILSWKLEEKRE